MPAPKLIPVSYRDSGNVIHLTCYADTLVYTKSDSNTGWLIGIRIGGYPEQVRGMSDAIYGGGEIRDVAPALSAYTVDIQGLAKRHAVTVGAEHYWVTHIGADEMGRTRITLAVGEPGKPVEDITQWSR